MTTEKLIGTCSLSLYGQMEPLTADWFDRETKCESTYSLIDAFRVTHNDKLKRRLPVCSYQAMFGISKNKKGVEGTWRVNHSATLTGQVMMDVDHIEDAEALADSWLKREDFKDLGILLLYVTPSGKGLKLVFKARKEWGNLIDNQYEMANVLGVTIDRSCKDAARSSFIPKSCDVKYLSEELFTYADPSYDEAYGKLYRNYPAITRPTKAKWREYEKQLRKQKKAAKDDATKVEEPVEAEDASKEEMVKAEDTSKEEMVKTTDASVAETSEPATAIMPAEALYHGVSYVKIATELEGIIGRPEKGDRHATMLKMGNMLSVICDNNPLLLIQIMSQLDFVKDMISEDGPAELERAMQYICERPSYMYPTQDLKKALVRAGVTTKDKSEDAATDELPLEKWADRIEALMPHFPCLREVCMEVPRKAWAAALFTAGGMYATLMTRCTYHYYFQPNKERRLNCNIKITGSPASGKSFAVKLDNIIMAPIREETNRAHKAANEYKHERRARETSKQEQNKAALKKPEAVRRYATARTSNSVFIENMQNAKEIVDGREMQLHLYTFDSEMSNTTNIQKGGSWIDKSAMELKAFHNEEDGQDYANQDSVSGLFKVHWNTITTGTVDALRSQVTPKNIGSGLSTRIAAIPMPRPSFQIEEETNCLEDIKMAEDVLSQWSSRQDKRHGELPLKDIVACSKEWTAEHLEIAEYNNCDQADHMIIQRVGYYGIAIAAPFIDMRHSKEFDETGTYATDDIDIQLARLVMDIQYCCQHYYFGGMIYNYFENLERDKYAYSSSHKTRFVECYNMLPENFTTEQFAKIFGLANTDSASRQLRTLVNEKAIVREKRGMYRKVEASIA